MMYQNYLAAMPEMKSGGNAYGRISGIPCL